MRALPLWPAAETCMRAMSWWNGRNADRAINPLHLQVVFVDERDFVKRRGGGALRSAVEHGMEEGAREHGCQVTGVKAWFWYSRGRPGKERRLGHATDTRPKEDLILCLGFLGQV